MMTPLFMILLCLMLAYIFSEFFKNIGVPRVVGQITAGLILGFFVFNNQLFTQDELKILSFLANLGVVLLFYYIGLEVNLKSFTKHLKKSFTISILNTLIPFIIGFLVSKLLFNFDTIVSAIIGICLSVSAEAVSMDLLDEFKMMRSRIGSIIISAGAVDDILELFILTIVVSVFHLSLNKTTAFSQLVLGIGLFVIILALARILIIPNMLKAFDKEKSSTARFTGAIIIVFLVAALADLLGIGALIGAMIAGMLTRQTIFKSQEIKKCDKYDIARSLHIISFGFLIPLFFVWVGLNSDLSLFSDDYLFLTIILTMISVIGTVGGTALAVKLSKGSFKEGMIIGWGLNPKGDVELVVAVLALQAGIISNPLFTSLIVMSLITTIISPIAFKYLLKNFKETNLKSM